MDEAELAAPAQRCRCRRASCWRRVRAASQRGGPHFGSPDKVPGRAARDASRRAGRARGPVHHRHPDRHRRDARRAHRGAAGDRATLHERHGHIQEVIVQNFRAKPGHAHGAARAEPTLDDHALDRSRWRGSCLRPAMNIQAPPNLQPDGLAAPVGAGINDWGGVSPVTPDHVNPEAPWPQLDELARGDRRRRPARWWSGSRSTRRYVRATPAALARSGRGARAGAAARRCRAASAWRGDGWAPGSDRRCRRRSATTRVVVAAARSAARRRLARRGDARRRGLDERRASSRCSPRAAPRSTRSARRPTRCAPSAAATTVTLRRQPQHQLHQRLHLRLRFCAFSKGRQTPRPARPALRSRRCDEIVRRAREAWERGATEVCLQGGIHPGYTGDTYLDVCRGGEGRACPDMHVHAFSPLEVPQGADTLGHAARATTSRGCGRRARHRCPAPPPRSSTTRCARILCPDKLNTAEWLEVMRSRARGRPAHHRHHHVRPRRPARALGAPSAAHPRPAGATPAASPSSCRCRSCTWRRRSISRAVPRRGPTFREAVLMHAVARLVLASAASRTSRRPGSSSGPDGAGALLGAGANDLGGTLMNESISRAAGASTARSARRADGGVIRCAGRTPAQRTTLYGRPARGAARPQLRCRAARADARPAVRRLRAGQAGEAAPAGSRGALISRSASADAAARRG